MCEPARQGAPGHVTRPRLVHTSSGFSSRPGMSATSCTGSDGSDISIRGQTFSGSQVRPFEVAQFVAAAPEFFASDDANLTISADATELLFTVRMVWSSDGERASFIFDAHGLDAFECTGQAAFRSQLFCDGNLTTIRLDVSTCPRFLRDPGFSYDLHGARSMTLAYPSEARGIQLQTLCRNLPPLRRARTSTMPASSSMIEPGRSSTWPDLSAITATTSSAPTPTPTLAHASPLTAAVAFGPAVAGGLVVWLALRTLTRRMVARARVCELARDDELVEKPLSSPAT